MQIPLAARAAHLSNAISAVDAVWMRAGAVGITILVCAVVLIHTMIDLHAICDPLSSSPAQFAPSGIPPTAIILARRERDGEQYYRLFLLYCPSKSRSSISNSNSNSMQHHIAIRGEVVQFLSPRRKWSKLRRRSNVRFCLCRCSSARAREFYRGHLGLSNFQVMCCLSGKFLRPLSPSLHQLLQDTAPCDRSVLRSTYMCPATHDANSE